MKPHSTTQDVVPIEVRCPSCGKQVPTQLVDYQLHNEKGVLIGEGTRRELLPHEGCRRTLL